MVMLVFMVLILSRIGLRRIVNTVCCTCPHGGIARMGAPVMLVVHFAAVIVAIRIIGSRHVP